MQIPFNKDDTNAIMVQRIQESGKYNVTNESGTGKIEATKDGRRKHPTLGEYKKVIVHPVGSANQNTSIFVSINLYTAEFQPREQVELPTEVIKFLKQPTIPEHYYDKRAISENGNVGAHMTRYVPKYIVESVE